MSVVELGCGNGNNLRQCKQALVKVGVEVVADYPVRNEDDIIFEIGDALEWAKRYDKEAFELVLLIDVLEHFEKEKGKELLQQAQRICHDKILLWMPEGDCPQNQEVYVSDGYPYQPSQDHVAQWTKEELEEFDFDVARWDNYHFNRETGQQSVPALFAVWRRNVEWERSI